MKKYHIYANLCMIFYKHSIISLNIFIKEAVTLLPLTKTKNNTNSKITYY